MGFAVEVYFDQQTERRIRRLWQELADRNVCSVLPAIGSRPHLSLAVYDHVDPEEVRPALAELAALQAPLQVDLTSVGTFPGAECVVFVAPDATPELLDLHRRVCARLAEFGLRTHEYYRPGRWVPHCTIAMELEPAQVPRALEICRASDVCGPSSIVEIGLVQFRPVCEICTFPLSFAPGPRPLT